ncbi:MAG: restriction endonuclease subunit S, partial [Acidobacteriia bacterium]|nr:restriction endonuclease subunit S [Terriglobia bacterium]
MPENNYRPTLPDGWRWVQLGEVCEFLDSRRIPVNDSERAKRIVGKQQSELFPYYGANGQVGWIDDYIFDEPLILLAEDGGNFGSVDRPIAYAVSGRYWVNNHAHVLKPREGLDFGYCLHALRIRPDVGDLVSGSTRAKLNQEIAARIPIPLPSLQEQKRIAGILNEQMEAVERARAAAEAQLAAAKALPAAYLRAVFNSSDAQRWPKKPLGDVSQLKNGINFTSSQKGRGTLTVDVLNMYSEGVYVQMDGLYRVDVQPKDEYQLQAGDILFVRSSVKREGVAWPAVFGGYAEPVTFCGFLIRARLTTPVIQAPFMIHYLRLPEIRESLVSKSGTGTITNIGQEDLKALPIPLPPLPDQQRIAAMLNEQM